VGGFGSPSEQSDATPVNAMICVYLRDLRFLRGQVSGFVISLCLGVFVFCDVGGWELRIEN
jgi:hypothetical protein